MLPLEAVVLRQAKLVVVVVVAGVGLKSNKGCIRTQPSLDLRVEIAAYHLGAFSILLFQSSLAKMSISNRERGVEVHSL